MVTLMRSVVAQHENKLEKLKEIPFKKIQNALPYLEEINTKKSIFQKVTKQVSTWLKVA